MSALISRIFELEQVEPKNATQRMLNKAMYGILAAITILPWIGAAAWLFLTLKEMALFD